MQLRKVFDPEGVWLVGRTDGRTVLLSVGRSQVKFNCCSFLLPGIFSKTFLLTFSSFSSSFSFLKVCVLHSQGQTFPICLHAACTLRNDEIDDDDGGNDDQRDGGRGRRRSPKLISFLDRTSICQTMGGPKIATLII